MSGKPIETTTVCNLQLFTLGRTGRPLMTNERSESQTSFTQELIESRGGA